MPFDQRTVIHNHKGLGIVARGVGLPNRFTIPENPFVRRVHDHANLVGWTASAQKELSERLICRQDGIGKSDAPSFEYFEKSDWIALLRKPEDSHHQLRHRIMKIEDHLSAKEFWDQRAEDQDVRHVVNMNKVIPALERSSCQNPPGEQNE